MQFGGQGGPAGLFAQMAQYDALFRAAGCYTDCYRFAEASGRDLDRKEVSIRARTMNTSRRTVLQCSPGDPETTLAMVERVRNPDIYPYAYISIPKTLDVQSLCPRLPSRT